MNEGDRWEGLDHKALRDLLEDALDVIDDLLHGGHPDDVPAWMLEDD